MDSVPPPPLLVMPSSPGFLDAAPSTPPPAPSSPTSASPSKQRRLRAARTVARFVGSDSLAELARRGLGCRSAQA
eukprot:6254684-Alexandrium_andersonii.AAC.1